MTDPTTKPMRITIKDRQKAKRLVQLLIPSKSAYNDYVNEAEAFMDEFNWLKRNIPTNQAKIYRLKMLESQIFGRKYVAAFVSEDWFHQISTHCDAVASPSLSFIGLASPPLVVIPGHSIPKLRGFSSILEHEFTHVNQAILGRFPRIDDCLLKERILFDELTKFTKAEYEANFIQLVHDQTHFPNGAEEVGLEKWCHLRGYTQGLETALLRLVKEGAPLSVAKGLLARIEREIPSAFANARLSRKIGMEFAGDVEKMSKIAMCILTERDRELTKCPAFRALGKWIFRNHA